MTALKKIQRQDYARCSKEVNKKNLASLDKSTDRLDQIGLRYHGSEAWIEAKVYMTPPWQITTIASSFQMMKKSIFRLTLDVADVTLKQAKTKYETLKHPPELIPMNWNWLKQKLKKPRSNLICPKKT